MRPRMKEEVQVSATLRLKTDVLSKYREIAGLTSDTELADRMGVDSATLWRVLNGRNGPSAKFIAALPAAFSGVTLDDLWEVVTENTPQAKEDQ